MSYKYVGWIPTVGGRLSFSIIGNSQCNTANRADENCRYLLAYQIKSLSDSVILPDFIWSLLNKSGRFVFVCYAKASNNPTDQNASLEGRLAVFDTGGRGISELQDELKKRQRQMVSQSNEQSLKLIYEDSGRLLSYQIESASLATFDFCLQRNGLVKINNPISSNELELNERSYDTLAAQAYFFLKDLCHVHQHHHPHTDTMVDLYKETPDDRWKAETVRALYRLY